MGEARMPGVADLRLLGERLCLNFANTVDPRQGDHPRDFLAGYPDLLAWSVRVGVLDAATGRELTEAAGRDPAGADQAYADAVRLREVMYRVFSAIAAGSAPPEVDLATLNQAWASSLAHARLEPDGAGYRWGWRTDPPALDRMLWPVLRSAGDLLTSDELDRVKECPGLGDCGWLFFDTSKNGSRRWCSMEGCGNRAKGRRHYRRTRTGPGHATR
jgi:predicted RNA-binding Zn ribbon-like protein